MSTVRKITPETGKKIGVRQATKPFTHSMQEFFENFWPRRWMETEPFAWTRPTWDVEPMFEPMGVDVMDRDDALVVRAELPGVTREGLEITLAGDYLTIEAKKEFKEEEKAETFYRSELGYGKLARTVYLPVEVDPEKTKAILKDGILELVLPKVRAVKRHTIKVA